MKKFLSEAEATFALSSDPTVHTLVLRENPPVGSEHMMKLRLEELLLLLLRDHTAPTLKQPNLRLQDSYDDELVGEMVRYMHEHVGETVTIKDLCQRFSYGKTYLCARFSAATGKSINRYFTELKITAAKQIIREKNASGELFSYISEMLGFSSPSYFYTTFKRITGMTPTEYSKSVHQYDKH